MQTGNWLLDILLYPLNIGLVPVIVMILSIVVLICLVIYLLKFAGIGTALFYISRGNTLKIFSAKETEKYVRASKTLAFSKISDGEHAATPLVYQRKFRPRRAFLAFEGHPTIVSWNIFKDENYKLPEFTAEDLSNIVDGTIAKGLAKALITAIKSDWVKILMGFLIGLFFMATIYPFIFPAG